MELAYRLALNAIRDNPEEDAEQQMLLQAMAREAKGDFDIAMANLADHECIRPPSKSSKFHNG